MSKFAIGFYIVLSIISMVLAVAPFTSAVGISFIMLLVAGLLGYKAFFSRVLFCYSLIL